MKTNQIINTTLLKMLRQRKPITPEQKEYLNTLNLTSSYNCNDKLIIESPTGRWLDAPKFKRRVKKVDIKNVDILNYLSTNKKKMPQDDLRGHNIVWTESERNLGFYNDTGYYSKAIYNFYLSKKKEKEEQQKKKAQEDKEFLINVIKEQPKELFKMINDGVRNRRESNKVMMLDLMFKEESNYYYDYEIKELVKEFKKFKEGEV